MAAATVAVAVLRVVLAGEIRVAVGLGGDVAPDSTASVGEMTGTGEVDVRGVSGTVVSAVMLLGGVGVGDGASVLMGVFGAPTCVVDSGIGVDVVVAGNKTVAVASDVRDAVAVCDAVAVDVVVADGERTSTVVGGVVVAVGIVGDGVLPGTAGSTDSGGPVRAMSST